MRETLRRMFELQAEGRRFAAATVVRTQGSTPQVIGARLLLDDRGEISGTLGGGCVEADAIAEARRVLAQGGSSLRAYELTEPLAWDTGLVCGGTMWIHIEPDHVAIGGDWGEKLRAVMDDGACEEPVAFGTLLRVDGRTLVADGHSLIEYPGEKRSADTAGQLLREAVEKGVARVVPLGGGRELLVEPIVSRPRLIIAGGGHVALALAQMARLLDFAITVIDDREEFANHRRFPGVDVVHGDIAATISSLDVGWNTFIIVATRGHKLDAHCLRAAVATNARYVGLLGSERKTILIEKMLRAEGVSEARLRAVHAPVGLNLGGRTPAEIALSILAEISHERHGSSETVLRVPRRRLKKAAAAAVP